MAIFGRKKEEPKPDFSDVRSGGSTAPAEPGGATPAAARSYTVVSGDSLSKIAQREYGDASKWRAIYEANRGQIKNPDLIQPGQVLNIPPAS